MNNRISKSIILSTILLFTTFNSHCYLETAKKFVLKNKEPITAACIVGGFFSIPFLIQTYDNYKEDNKTTRQIIIETQSLTKEVNHSPFVEDAKKILTNYQGDIVISECVNTHCPGFRLPFLTYYYQLNELLKKVHYKHKSIGRRLQNLEDTPLETKELLHSLDEDLAIIKKALEALRKEVTHHAHYTAEANLAQHEQWQTQHNLYPIITL